MIPTVRGIKGLWGRQCFHVGSVEEYVSPFTSGAGIPAGSMWTSKFNWKTQACLILSRHYSFPVLLPSSWVLAKLPTSWFLGSWIPPPFFSLANMHAVPLVASSLFTQLPTLTGKWHFKEGKTITVSPPSSFFLKCLHSFFFQTCPESLTSPARWLSLTG